MNKTRHFVNVLAFAAFTIALSAVAQAQATRTWVSGVGDDVNPCSRTAPCKTYAGAISKTARDGEISTLDPGGFGAVTITKSITINGGGQGQGYGSILASSTTGVIVNITDPADLRKTVRLNWLDINGAPSTSPGLSGIRVLSASVVHIENTIIDAFRSTSVGFGHGIHANVTIPLNIHIRNTTVRNCLNDGIRLEQNGANPNQIVASIVNSKIDSNATGIRAVNGVAAMISDCEITGNSATGIDAEEGTLNTFVNVEGCRIAFSTNGVQAGAGASDVRLSNNFITQNGTGISIAGGTVNTSGNNRVIGNTTPVAGGALQATTQPI
jgi:hypothetical protein